MKLIRNCIKTVGNEVRKVMFWIKLRIMDWNWYVNEKDSFNDIPPSFYCTHTQEEVAQLKANRIAKLREMLEKYAQEE